MKKKVFALAFAAMAVLGAQAQTSVYTWDEDFIKNISLSCNTILYEKTEVNNSRDGIDISLVYDKTDYSMATTLYNGKLSFDSSKGGVYFKTETGTFTKIVITYSSGTKIDAVAGGSWVNNGSGTEKTLTWSGDANKVKFGYIGIETYDVSLQIKQIDFTIVGLEGYTISDVPEGWTVNGQLPDGGKVKIGKGSAVVVKPANIPTGKKIKSIKFVKDE